MAKRKNPLESALENFEQALVALRAEYEANPNTKTYSVIITTELNIHELKNLIK